MVIKITQEVTVILKICYVSDVGGKATRLQYVKKKKKKKKKPHNKVNIVLSKKEMKDNRKRKYVDIKINKQTVQCLLDTGSDISIIDESTWKK